MVHGSLPALEMALTVTEPEPQVTEGEILTENQTTHIIESKGSDGIGTLWTVVLRDGQLVDFDIERTR